MSVGGGLSLPFMCKCIEQKGRKIAKENRGFVVVVALCAFVYFVCAPVTKLYQFKREITPFFCVLVLVLIGAVVLVQLICDPLYALIVKPGQPSSFCSSAVVLCCYCNKLEPSY